MTRTRWTLLICSEEFLESAQNLPMVFVDGRVTTIYFGYTGAGDSLGKLS